MDEGTADATGAATTVAGPLDEVLAELDAVLGKLAAAELDFCADGEVREVAIGLQTAANRLAGQQLRLLGEVGQRGIYEDDGAVSLSSWWRGRTRLDPPKAATVAQAAARIPHFPLLGQALAEGDITVDHVIAVTTAAVPRRRGALQEVEDTLVELAGHGQPQDLRRVIRRIADVVDPDGSDPPPPLSDNGPDARRGLQLHPTIDGLWDLRATLDVLHGELLAGLLDAFDKPDPPDTPEHHRRSPGQRRADALAAILAHVAGCDHPTVGGLAAHIYAMCDLGHFAGGPPEDAVVTPRLRYSGEVPLAVMRRLAAHARITAVKTMGPWRPTDVGRTHRVLPSWLRGILALLHRQCRGPDCDRPAAWTQAHHETGWTEGGNTSLQETIPLCQAHHDLVTSGDWHVALDLDHGTCVWTSAGGRTITTHPPT